MGNEVKKIDVVTLREELKVLSLAQLEEKYVALDFAELWKKGTNKAIAVDVLIKAIVEQQVGSEVEQTETVEDQIDDSIEPGEYEIDQDTLDEYPGLVASGFNIGDTLVIEKGKPWSKKSDLPKEIAEEYGGSEEGTKNIGTQKSPELVDKEIKEDNLNIKAEDITDPSDIPANGPHKEIVEPVKSEDSEEDLLDGNEVVKEYEPEVIDESKYTEDEILENIELCQANLKDALQTTRIILLRKMEALEAALDRKLTKKK